SGVTGNTADSGSVIQGSIPCSPAQRTAGSPPGRRPFAAPPPYFLVFEVDLVETSPASVKSRRDAALKLCSWAAWMSNLRRAGSCAISRFHNVVSTVTSVDDESPLPTRKLILRPPSCT